MFNGIGFRLKYCLCLTVIGLFQVHRSWKDRANLEISASNRLAVRNFLFFHSITMRFNRMLKIHGRLNFGVEKEICIIDGFYEP